MFICSCVTLALSIAHVWCLIDTTSILLLTVWDVNNIKTSVKTVSPGPATEVSFGCVSLINACGARIQLTPNEEFLWSLLPRVQYTMSISHCVRACGVHFRCKLWYFASQLLYRPIILLSNSHFGLLCAHCSSHYNVYWRQQLSIMQQFGASMFHTVMHQHNLGRWKMSVLYIIPSSWLSSCQKLPELEEV